MILRVKITNLNKSFYIHCNSCQLTNCVEPNLDKESAIMILLKRPGYILLPVELGNDPWFENSGLQALKRLKELIRPKRFVAALILGITALIAILTSFTLSTTALVQQQHTAHFVNDMHKNISVALSELYFIQASTSPPPPSLLSSFYSPSCYFLLKNPQSSSPKVYGIYC